MLLYPDTEQRLYLCLIVFYRVTLLFLVWRHFKYSPIRPFSCSLPAVKTQVQEPLIRNKIIQCQKTRMSRWLGAIFARCWNKDVGTRFSPYPKKKGVIIASLRRNGFICWFKSSPIWVSGRTLLAGGFESLRYSGTSHGTQSLMKIYNVKLLCYLKKIFNSEFNLI